MKREIKFRAKRKDNNKWAFGDLVKDNAGGAWIETNLQTWRENCDDVDAFGSRLYVDIDTVGQFTGLTDKKGREIYEGDILRNESCKGVVSYRNGAFVLDLGKSCGCVYLFCLDSLLVVGNIYDNPELLKTK